MEASVGVSGLCADLFVNDILLGLNVRNPPKPPHRSMDREGKQWIIRSTAGSYRGHPKLQRVQLWPSGYLGQITRLSQRYAALSGYILRDLSSITKSSVLAACSLISCGRDLSRGTETRPTMHDQLKSRSNVQIVPFSGISGGVNTQSRILSEYTKIGRHHQRA